MITQHIDNPMAAPFLNPILSKFNTNTKQVKSILTSFTGQTNHGGNLDTPVRNNDLSALRQSLKRFS